MQKKIQIVAKLFSCCKTFLSCRKTLLSCRKTLVSFAKPLLVVAKHFLAVAKHFLVVAKHLLVVAKPFLAVAKHLLVVAKPFLVVAKHFLVVANRETLLKESTVQTESETNGDVMMIYLPNSYHSKPKLPSLCQMDPASNCCLQYFFLRLLLFPGMNVLVTPESNPRELVCR